MINKKTSLNKPEVINTVWPFKVDETENWAYWENLFSPEECDNIVKLGLKYTKFVGEVRNKEKNKEKVRTSKISWIYPNDETNWIFQRISSVINNLNDRFFRFDLYGLVEGLQFTIYEAPDGKYTKHIDRGVGIPVRKLSFTLQLSDPNTYMGGDLELHFSETPVKVDKKRGYAAVFPSYVLHNVTPVKRGTRYSLVAWITGPCFK